MNYHYTNMLCEREKDDNGYCNQITETVNKCGEDNIAALTGCLGYMWSKFIAPIWSILSKPLQVKKVKAVVEKAQSMQLSRPATVIEDLKGIDSSRTDSDTDISDTCCTCTCATSDTDTSATSGTNICITGGTGTSASSCTNNCITSGTGTSATNGTNNCITTPTTCTTHAPTTCTSALVIQVLVQLVALVPVPLVIQLLVQLVALVPVPLVIQVLV